MKNYKVSLAGRKLVNIEWEGEASSKKEALKLALEAVDSGDIEIDEDFSGNIELDLPKRVSTNTSGVYIEIID